MKDDKHIDVYRRVLKYPPVAAKRRPGPMKIQHILNDAGTVMVEAPEYVTSEDLEKLYAVMYVSRIKGEVVYYEDVKSVKVRVHISSIRNICCAHDDKYIHDALQRVTKLTISFVFGKKYVTMHLLNRVEFDPSIGIITAYIDYDFYKRCVYEPLRLSVDTYCTLSPIAKNLYSFLVSNTANIFHENTLIERAVIQTSRTDKAQAMLRKALNELVSCGVIASYHRTKSNGQWIITIARQRPNPNSP